MTDKDIEALYVEIDRLHMQELDDYFNACEPHRWVAMWRNHEVVGRVCVRCGREEGANR